MFGLLFQKKDSAQKNAKIYAKELYALALNNTRKEVFYTKYGVPDTFDGRFDLLLVHIFILLHHMVGQDEHEELSQALFDVTFKDMDQTLREMGIGDVGIPKHMKRMMKAFNGRMHSYQAAIAPDSLQEHEIEGLQATTLEEALERNLYGAISNEEGFQQEWRTLMAEYIQKNLDRNAPEMPNILHDIKNIEFIEA